MVGLSAFHGASARRRHVVIGRKAARALSERLFQRGRTLIFAEQIGKGFVGKLLHASAAVFRQQVERKPDFRRKLDQLALDVTRMGASKHSAEHNRFGPVLGKSSPSRGWPRAEAPAATLAAFQGR